MIISPALRSCLVVILSVGLFTMAGGPILAASSIKVLVNDQPITSYEIAQRARLMRITGGGGSEKAATEELINELIEVREARRHGIRISDARVDAAIAEISKNVKMTAAQLKKALESQGVGIETLRERIRAQIAWNQVVQAKTRHDVSVKQSDVMAALAAKGGPDKQTTVEFTLQQIIFVVPKGSSAAYQAQRRREAEAFRGRFGGCDKAVEQAKMLKDVVVRKLGRRISNELTGDDGKEVQNTPVGKTTRPHPSASGVELIAVCSTRALDSNAAARSEVEMKLTLEHSKTVADSYLKELREKAIIQYR